MGNYLRIFSEKVILSGLVYHLSDSGFEWRERVLGVGMLVRRLMQSPRLEM